MKDIKWFAILIAALVVGGLVVAGFTRNLDVITFALIAGALVLSHLQLSSKD